MCCTYIDMLIAMLYVVLTLSLCHARMFTHTRRRAIWMISYDLDSSRTSRRSSAHPHPVDVMAMLRVQMLGVSCCDLLRHNVRMFRL